MRNIRQERMESGPADATAWRKPYSVWLMLALAWLLVFSSSAFAANDRLPSPMQPPRMVNDFAGIFSDADSTSLEQQVQDYQKKGGTQIYIVTVPDTAEEAALQYATDIGNAWGVGEHGKNNGIVLLIVPPHAGVQGQIAIAYGDGLTSSLSQQASDGIIKNTMAPLFQKQLYAEGTRQAVHMLSALLDEAAGRGTPLSGEAAGQQATRQKDESGVFDSLLKVILVVGGIIALLIVAVAVFAKLAGQTVLDVIRSIGGKGSAGASQNDSSQQSGANGAPQAGTFSGGRATPAERISGSSDTSIAGFDVPREGAAGSRPIPGFGDEGGSADAGGQNRKNNSR